ncbi:MAG TPA: STAS domain-containing protein [Verrucomicrobiae bacterium]|jgi:ABC-type transporter Mla MlaB component
MLKISRLEPVNHSTTLRLEGSLVGPWVEELEHLCAPLVSDGTQLKLELGEVSFVDDKGVALLASLRSHGTKLLNATPFLAEQLKFVR